MERLGHLFHTGAGSSDLTSLNTLHTAKTNRRKLACFLLETSAVSRRAIPLSA